MSYWEDILTLTNWLVILDVGLLSFPYLVSFENWWFVLLSGIKDHAGSVFKIIHIHSADYRDKATDNVENYFLLIFSSSQRTTDSQMKNSGHRQKKLICSNQMGVKNVLTTWKRLKHETIKSLLSLHYINDLLFQILAHDPDLPCAEGEGVKTITSSLRPKWPICEDRLCCGVRKKG